MSVPAKSPRVAHVVPALFGWDNVFGGGERYALELAHAMASRVSTRLVTFHKSPRNLRYDDLDVRVLRNWVPYRRLRFDPFPPSLVRELMSADIVHVHQPETMMASISLLCAKALRRPIFTTHLGGAGYGFHRFTDVTGWYDGHLHLSEFSQRHFGHAGLPSARPIFAGVNTERFCPPPASSGVERTDVVYVGRLLPHKGINYLIEAIDPGVPLTIVGRRWAHAAKFDQLLMKLAEGKRVEFVEGKSHAPGVWAHQDDEDIIRACQKALCVVLPSVHETVFGEHHSIPELFGLVVIEGMACGAPAIVTNVCSLPELVTDGVTGFIVPPNDAQALRDRIRWLKEHPVEARKMGEAARKRVLDVFSWDRVVDRCLEAYGVVKPRAAGRERARQEGGAARAGESA